MRYHHLPALAVSVALGLTLPAWAEDRSQRFLDLMSNLPQEIWANRSRSMPEFMDYGVAAQVTEVLVAAHPGKVNADARRITSGPFPSDTPEVADWSLTVGFGRDDILASVLTREGADSRLALLLTSDVMAGIAPALLATGYAQSEDRGYPAFWRTEEDNAFDLTLRNPDDPFASSVPLASRIALKGDVLLHASNWPGLDSLANAKGASPALQALASALDLPDWGERQVVQAIIFSDPSSFSPGFRLAEGLTPVEPPPGEVPYWSNLMLADLSDGTSDLTLIVLLYTSRSDAEAAAKAMETGLPAAAFQSFGDKTLGELAGTGTAIVAGDGPYLAIYALQTEPELRSAAFPRNRGYHILLTAAFTRELYLLGPAAP
jgi:hypothetical protein